METTEEKPRRLTARQQHCMPPSIREIVDRFKLSSPNAVMGHMRALIKKGRVMRIGDKGNARANVAIYPDDRCPCCGRKPIGSTELSRAVNKPDPATREVEAKSMAEIPGANMRALWDRLRSSGLPVPGEQAEGRIKVSEEG
jgi:SOS-response transcriptional repressor LexA